MRIRIASPDDLKFIEGTYEHARAFMQANGNATQWPDGYPGRIDAEEDIAPGHCFLVADDKGPLAVFSFATGPDETWLFIIEGVGVVGGVGRVVAGYGSRSSDDGGSDTVHLKDLDMSNTIFDRPDLSAFTRLDGLGLEVTGQRIEPDHAVLACRITGEDRWCRRCGCQGVARDTVVVKSRVLCRLV